MFSHHCEHRPSEVSHDPESDFLQSVKLVNFKNDDTDFVTGRGDSCLQKSRRNSALSNQCSLMGISAIQVRILIVNFQCDKFGHLKSGLAGAMSGGSGKGKKGGNSGKLVDVVAVRTRFSCKLASSIKFASTALCEACEKFRTFVDKDEPEFYERFLSGLAGFDSSQLFPF